MSRHVVTKTRPPEAGLQQRDRHGSPLICHIARRRRRRCRRFTGGRRREDDWACSPADRMRLGTQRQSRGPDGDRMPDELIQSAPGTASKASADSRRSPRSAAGSSTRSAVCRTSATRRASNWKSSAERWPTDRCSDRFPTSCWGKDPERDREIDLFCELIRTAAQAGVPCVKYNLSILKVMRTDPTPGRGGAQYSTWVYAKAPKLPLTTAGEVPGELFWERITLLSGARDPGRHRPQNPDGLPSA